MGLPSQSTPEVWNAGLWPLQQSFFAFYGFDAISTAAEETKNPSRDLSIGIIGSMIGCTLIYVLVALAAIGAMHYTVFGPSTEPLALILRQLDQGNTARLIGAAAIIALPTVLLAFYMDKAAFCS